MIIPAIKKTYNGKTVLNIPETEIEDGSLTVILGHNGSGKSTLSKILAGIIKDDSGFFLRLPLKVGYMTQASLPFRMSVRRNLLLNAGSDLSAEEKHQLAEKLIDEIGLTEYASKNAKKLSGGQIERMAFARILMKKYDLLILDEPMASMDQAAIPMAEKMLLNYQKGTGCTILLITHSADQASRLAESIIRLENGELSGKETAPLSDELT